MKKILTLFTAAVFAVGMYAASFGIMINGSEYHAGDQNPSPLDPSFQEYMALGVSVSKGATLQLWDQENKAGWAVDLDGASVSTIVRDGDHYNCTADGCYDFYIKIKLNADQLYVGACSGDNPGGGEDNPPVTPPSDAGYWYWKGSLDGVDINSEVDGGLFDCGVSEIEVKENGYLFVVYQVHGVPGVQYMAPSYVDGPTHATMTTTGNEKLHIPAGNWTLYLYDNGDGTVELSFEELSGKNLVGCEGQGIENTLSTDKAHKVIIDGQLRIIRGNKVFDATGQQL